MDDLTRSVTVGAALGFAGGSFYAWLGYRKRMAEIAAAASSAPPPGWTPPQENPDAPAVPPEASVQALYLNAAPLGCPNASRSYYGVYSWDMTKDPVSGSYLPQWVVLSRHKGSQLTEMTYPVMDSYYATMRDRVYPLGVWTGGMNCDGSGVWYQVARGYGDQVVAGK